MSYQLPDFVIELIDKIANDTGIIDYRIETESGSKQNDGIVAALISVALIGNQKVADSPAVPIKLQLMCKLMPENATKCKEWCIDQLFEREVLMYTKVLPLFLEFQREKGLTADQCFQAYPKCYASIVDHTKGRYAIIMEDLRSRDFRMWDCRTAPPVDHLKCVLGELAKFHAVSFALKDQRPQVFDELRQLDDLIMSMYYNGGMDNMMNEACDHAIAIADNPRFAAKLTELKKNNLEIMGKYVRKEMTTECGVIGHGDCWTNNSMFRYDDESNLSEVCILDWQLGRYQSLYLELHDVTLLTSGRETRQHFPQIFKYYFDELCVAIQRLGTDPSKFLNFDAFMARAKYFGDYGFSLAVFAAPLILPSAAESDEKTSQEQADWKLYVAPAPTAFKKRINELVEDCVEMGYIHL